MTLKDDIMLDGLPHQLRRGGAIHWLLCLGAPSSALDASDPDMFARTVASRAAKRAEDLATTFPNVYGRMLPPPTL